MNETLKRRNFLTVREIKLWNNLSEGNPVRVSNVAVALLPCPCLLLHPLIQTPTCEPTSQPALRPAPPPSACGVTAGLGADAGYHHQPCPPCSHGDGYHTGLPLSSLSFLPSNKVPPWRCWICAQLLPLDHKHHHFARSSIPMCYCYTSAYTRDREKKLERCRQAWWLSLSTVSIQTSLYVKLQQNPIWIKGTFTEEILCFIDNVCCHTAPRRVPFYAALLLPPMFFENNQSLVTACMCYLSSFPYFAQHIHLTFSVSPYSPAQKSLVCSPSGTCYAFIKRKMHWTQRELGKPKARCLHSPFPKIFLVRGQRRAMCRNSGPTCDLAQSLPGLPYTNGEFNFLGFVTIQLLLLLHSASPQPAECLISYCCEYCVRHTSLPMVALFGNKSHEMQ